MNDRSGFRWGILGCGNIAGKFARDLAAHGITVAAVASRDSGRASAFAEGLGIPRAYGDYADLLADPGLDAIYVALPNHMHAEWGIRAARTGKHVLCEKPASLIESEVVALVDSARQARVFCMEGFMYALHPQWKLAQSLIEADAIGPVKSLSATFCYDMGQKPGNIRLSPEAWGGAFADVGCYGVHFARRFAKVTPTRGKPAGKGTAGDTPSGMPEGPARILRARSLRGPEGVDERTALSLEFPSGVTAEVYCALRETRPAQAVIQGVRGRIEIPQPWHPPVTDAEVRIFNSAGDRVYHAGDGLAAFAREAREVETHAAQGQSPTLTWDDAIAQARMMERVRAAVEWE